MLYFSYDPKIQEALSRFISKDEGIFSPNFKNQAEAVNHFLKLMTSDAIEIIKMDAGKSIQAWELAYYFVMEKRIIPMPFFPVHDLCLLMANILANAQTNNEKKELAVLNWELLPPALLLSSMNYRILLPHDSSSIELMDTLRLKLPDQYFDWLPEQLPKDCTVLGTGPADHLDSNPNFFQWLNNAQSGVFFTGWDFLGMKIRAHARKKWLREGRLSFIFQLPRPRRQGYASYPVLLGFGHENPHTIRLARIPDIGPGPGALDQTKALKLISGPPMRDASLDLERLEPEKERGFNLTPALWLNKVNVPIISAGPTLENCAEIIRCQLPRKKLHPTWVKEVKPALDEPSSQRKWLLRRNDEAENPNPLEIQKETAQPKYGPLPDGSWLLKEVSQANFDPLSSFLIGEGSDVNLDFRRYSSQDKYLLRKNDILFPFKGTGASIGKPGFVFEETRLPTVVSPAYVVIRPLQGVNPAWLFWYLQWPKTREAILARATGSGMLTINIEEIRKIPIQMPEDGELSFLMAKHQLVHNEMNAIREQRERMRRDLADLWSLSKEFE